MEDPREQALTVECEPIAGGSGSGASAWRSPVVVSRRTILRGASAALPTILTLNSGAAFAAISSNTISAASGTPTVTSGTRTDYICLDASSTASGGEISPGSGIYDLGDPPYGDATGIPADREYLDKAGAGTDKVTGPQMCASGGNYEYKGVTYSVPKGGLLSATALNSFTGRINVKYI